MTEPDGANARHDGGRGGGSTERVAWLPDLLYTAGRFRGGLAVVCDERGTITRIARADDQITCRVVRLRDRALLPGMVNAHSHAFQRVIRGRTEHRSSASTDSFWTWREAMYAAAARLTPEDIYDASRMAFLEMLAGGITSVGEFHYLHRTPEGDAYDDPNLLAKEVVRAARDTGLRVALLRVAYARSGYEQPPNARQVRFIEPDVETYLRHTEQLSKDLRAEEERVGNDSTTRRAWVGVAPHSVRAVPLPYLRDVCEFAAKNNFAVHMHVAEQPAEVAACLAEHGRTPVALLADEGLLNENFTGVHAVHITPAEARSLADARATVCACPTTERNLGDGVVPADLLFAEGVSLSLGTDSHAQIDLLEDARELEYHLRLQKLERNVLAPDTDGDDTRARTNGSESPTVSALAARLFACATSGGARSIGATCGELAAGRPADFFTVALDDPSIAGSSEEDLLSSIVFSLARTAVKEVAVGGELIVKDGAHRASGEIVERFAALQKRLWA